jgi:hypothetical protein
MLPDPTDFTEASLAEQIFSVRPDVEADALLESAAHSKCLRPLKRNELVRRGDFIEDGHDGFEPWEGPSGFRADAFVKQIYRRLSRLPAEVSKPG